MVTAQAKAAVLIEALPYIRRFYGKTIVIKYGGHAMANCELKRAVLEDVILMKYIGMHPVLVHGGGPEITAMLSRLGKGSKFVNGLRITDAETMEIVEMVLEKINKDLVARINCLGGRAVGLSGKDGQLIAARRQVISRTGDGEGQVLDLGYVGEVEGINPEIIETLVEKGYIPVVAPIGVGKDGESYNINADHVAGALAGALKADKLVLLTDVEGVFMERDGQRELISSLHVADIPELIEAGILSGGMIPKVECCREALRLGAGKTHIIDGRIPHSILLEIFTDEGIGTQILP